MSYGAKFNIALTAACPFPTSQGSQVFIHELACALTKAGHQVHLVAYDYCEFEIDTPYRIHRIPRLIPGRKLRAGPSLAKPFLDLLMVAKLTSVCLRHKIDLIHAVNYEAALIGYAVRRLVNLPVLYHAHGLLEMELPTYFSRRWLKRRAAGIGRWIERIIYRGADGVAALTDHDARFARLQVGQQTAVRRINPAVSVDDSAVKSNEADINKEPIFIYVGNLDHYQGLNMVLQAFVLVLRELPTARLRIITFSDSASLMRIAGRLGIENKIIVDHNLGFDQTCAAIRQSCVALVPRLVTYGFPIKLLNYLALGVPTIVSQKEYDGLVHGQNCWLVEPTAESFAVGMIKLARDTELRRTIAGNARRLVADNYQWSSAVLQIEVLYELLIREPSLAYAGTARTRRF